MVDPRMPAPGVRASLLQILLVVQDDPLRVKLEAALLQHVAPGRLLRCGSLEEVAGMSAEELGAFDVALLSEPWDGLQAVELVHQLEQRGTPMPCVLLVGAPTVEAAVRALRWGVEDYLVRDPTETWLEQLPSALIEAARRGRVRRVREVAEEEIRVSERLLGQIFDGLSVATFVLDAEHRVTHWSRSCEALTGVRASAVTGTGEHWRAFYPDKRPCLADLVVDNAVEAEVDRFYGTKKIHRSTLLEGAWEAEDYFPNFGTGGRWLFFTASPIRDARGKVVGAIETLQDTTDRKQIESALRDSEERYRLLSITDGMTGLYNSRHFFQRLEEEMLRADRHGHALSLLLLDVDDFKRFNDTFGHLEGDQMLRALATVIRNCIRRSDQAFRYGGEEFVVLLPETGLDEAQTAAERIRSQFASVELEPSTSGVQRGTVSIGATLYQRGESGRDFVARADRGAYEAKAMGKNRAVIVPEDG
jgi:diguanylate cyclase (GGDEF)-like protein